MQSLQTELDAFQQSFNASVTEKVVSTFANGIEEVRQSGIVKNALQVGDPAPDFELSNAIGKKVSHSTLLKKGPVVLTWYSGGWCPYCNIE